jgi:hypothetical protein
MSDPIRPARHAHFPRAVVDLAAELHNCVTANAPRIAAVHYPVMAYIGR